MFKSHSNPVRKAILLFIYFIDKEKRGTERLINLLIVTQLISRSQGFKPGSLAPESVPTTTLYRSVLSNVLAITGHPCGTSKAQTVLTGMTFPHQ